MNLLESENLPKVKKTKTGVPTVIEWNGQRYILDNVNQQKPKRKTCFKNPIKVPVNLEGTHENKWENL